MKKFFAVLLAVALLLPTPALGVGAAGAVVMEAQSGLLLFDQDAHRRLPMASTTKIMTALLTLEQPGLDEEFMVDPAAIRVEGSSMGLVAGDTVTLRALAVGMLTTSGNDAANAAAVRIAGDIPAFAARMNRRAAELGMTGTHFVTPSGLDDEQHYSTAYDMALLARAALQNPDFLAICSAKRVQTRFGNPPYDRTLYNHNRLLSLYPEAIGVKTGFTKKSGRCLVSAARRGEVTLIAVTLNCGDDWNTHKSLYEQCFPQVETQTLPQPGQPPQEALSMPVAGGTAGSVPLAVEGSLSYTQPSAQPRPLKWTLYGEKFAYAPIKKGDRLGKIVYYIDDTPLGELPLVAAADVPAPPPPPQKGWQLWKETVEDWLWRHGLG